MACHGPWPGGQVTARHLRERADCRETNAPCEPSDSIQRPLPAYTDLPFEGLPELGIVDLACDEILPEPRQERGAGRAGCTCPPRDGAGRVRMLPVQIPALPGGKHWLLETDLGAEGLVLVQTPETLLESTDPLDRLAANQHAAGTGRQALTL